MVYKVMVMLHVLGAAVWIGGHAALVLSVLPRAAMAGEPKRITEFEQGFGRIGKPALGIQFITGLWLADRWIGDWAGLFSEPTPAGHLVLTKLVLLLVTVGLAVYASLFVLPNLHTLGFRRFKALAWTVTALGVLMLILGVGIRTGGLF